MTLSYLHKYIKNHQFTQLKTSKSRHYGFFNYIKIISFYNYFEKNVQFKKKIRLCM